MRAIARGKQVVPDAAWPLLDVLASAVGDGPIVGCPSADRVLMIAAHPDDETACAGLLALLARAGATVDVAFATRGDASRGSPFSARETGRRRQSEAERACALIGTTRPVFLGLPDGELHAVTKPLADAVRSLLERSQPQLVVLPWFLDGHSDHRAVNAALSALVLPPEVEVWGFEWWTPLPANRLVEVTEVLAIKESAARIHETATLAFDLQAGVGLSRYRSLFGLHGRGHAEAFLAAPAAEYVGLVKKYQTTGSTKHEPTG